MTLPYDLIIEGLVVILLMVTVFYCISLEAKLRALRSGKDELKGVIEALAKSTENAQASVYHLKAAGAQTATDLEKKISDARKLADELELMIGSGNALADRMEGVRVKPKPRPVASDQSDEDLFADGDIIRALKEAR